MRQQLIVGERIKTGDLNAAPDKEEPVIVKQEECFMTENERKAAEILEGYDDADDADYDENESSVEGEDSDDSEWEHIEPEAELHSDEDLYEKKRKKRLMPHLNENAEVQYYKDDHGKRYNADGDPLDVISDSSESDH